MTDATSPSKALAVKNAPVVPDDLSTHERVGVFLSRLFPSMKGRDAAAALVPWVCDRLPSQHSRRAYAGDLARFVAHMKGLGVDPFYVNGDHVRLYKEAMQRAKAAPSTIGRTLSVIRGTYRQFAAKGLIVDFPPFCGRVSKRVKCKTRSENDASATEVYPRVQGGSRAVVETARAECWRGGEEFGRW